MPLETTRFDIQEHLKTPEQQLAYIEAALDEDDPAFLAKALGEVARARGMTQVAKDAGVTREALYRALSEKGDPRLSTLMGVMKALGLKLRVAA
ncbi:addiction module antidote protein [Bosea sp. 2YAB26]|uniref:addiction module antidote protein n=1 Tax=Bosea sp. 2YAB26 TaxID=3237478 RepID=UPI003F915552